MLTDAEIMAVLPAVITSVGFFLHSSRSSGNRRLRDALDSSARVQAMRCYDPIICDENPLSFLFPLAHFSLPKRKSAAGLYWWLVAVSET